MSASAAPRPRNAAMARLLDMAVAAAPLLLLALLWETVVVVGVVSDQYLPRLSTVLSEIVRLSGNVVVFQHVLISLERVGAGLGLAVAVGVTAGLAMSMWRPAYVVLNPLLSITYPLPKSALVPLMMLLFGIGNASKIVLIFIGCLLPITIHTLNGARGVDQKLIWSARSLGSGAISVLTQIRFKAALPDILAGIRMGIAFAFILLINAELIFGQDGLGYLIKSTGGVGAYDTMFAVILFVVALGFAADQLFAALIRRTLSWRTHI